MIYTLFDLETNGFIKKDKVTNRSVFPEILEVGYIQVNDNLDILRGGEFYFYQPEWEIENGAQEVHGLERSFLEQHQSSFYTNMVKLYVLLQQANIVGKNSNAFDIPVAKEFITKRAPGISAPAIARAYDMQNFYTSLFRNKMAASNNGVSSRKKGTLTELIALEGFTQEQVQDMFNKQFPESERARAHGALYDSFMTYLLFKNAIQVHKMIL